MRALALVELGNEFTAYRVTFPAVPGCTSAGDTIDQALDNAKKAIQFHLEILKEEGHQLPDTSFKDLKIPEEFERTQYVVAVIELDSDQLNPPNNQSMVFINTKTLSEIDEYLMDNPQFKDRSDLLNQAVQKLLNEGS